MGLVYLPTNLPPAKKLPQMLIHKYSSPIGHLGFSTVFGTIIRVKTRGTGDSLDFFMICPNGSALGLDLDNDREAPKAGKHMQTMAFLEF